MFNLKNFMSEINTVDGWQTLEEMVGLLHFSLLIDNIDGEIVEIGSFKGKSTICIATGSKLLSSKKRPIYAVDPFKHSDDKQHFISMYEKDYFNDFWHNIEAFELEDFVLPIKKYSTDAQEEIPQNIAGIFIDGDHSYQGISTDINLYINRVVPGGIIAFHDYNNPHHPDVTKAVDELLLNQNFIVKGDFDLLRIIQKCAN
ncbi:class I SAM-dependent methyltransferase [Bacillus cereus]|uniref:class I SAM-dependent methyltransferase n=1 Tax=Bacillus cereus TaxID=1396 RepID=UPI00123A9530|nr:class I SAM-dependent methyltransferase [Bacillus cereus]KAA6470292.1 class I SAM-dependent methyltransferase [Bacillus cereus]